MYFVVFYNQEPSVIRPRFSPLYITPFSHTSPTSQSHTIIPHNKEKRPHWLWTRFFPTLKLLPPPRTKKV